MHWGSKMAAGWSYKSCSFISLSSCVVALYPKTFFLNILSSTISNACMFELHCIHIKPTHSDVTRHLHIQDLQSTLILHIHLKASIATAYVFFIYTTMYILYVIYISFFCIHTIVIGDAYFLQPHHRSWHL